MIIYRNLEREGDRRINTVLILKKRICGRGLGGKSGWKILLNSLTSTLGGKKESKSYCKNLAEDKKTGNSQHAFCKNKLWPTNLISFCDTVRRQPPQGAAVLCPGSGSIQSFTTESCFLNLQMTPNKKGLQVCWSIGTEIKMILTN